jgi:endonuclease/exonuclease/phosphatase (EEP) superfamily protein YafD
MTRQTASARPLDRPSQRLEPAALRQLDRVLPGATLIALVLTLASFAGGEYWPLELFTHFRIQFVIGAVVLLAAAAMLRRPAVVLSALFVAAANFMPLAPYVLTRSIEAQAAQPPLRVMSINVLFENGDYAAVSALIEHEDPDIIGLQEVTGAWVRALSGLHTSHPYAVLRPEEGVHGLALYSRVPIRERESSPYLEDGHQVAISVDLETLDRPVTLTLAHLTAPMSPERARIRNQQIATITETLQADADRAQIFIGDLNITPWSPYYARLEKEARLHNAAKGRGYRPTWPAGFMPMKIPIDHCLLSSGVQVLQFRTGPAVGSDHLPIIVDVVVRDKPAGAAPPAR